MFPYQLVIPAVALAALVLGIVLVVVARRDRRVRPWVIITAVSVIAMPAAILLHGVLSGMVGGEEGISFIVALLVAPVGIALGLVGSAVTLLREHREVGLGVAIGAAGVVLFAAYMLFVSVVTTVYGGNPYWQATTDAIAMTLAALLAAAGALWSVIVIGRGERPATA